MRSRSTAGHRGFTLIEILIVIIVIGILAAIAIPMYISQKDKAKDAAVKENVHTIEVGVVSYVADNNGSYPATEYVTYTPNDKTAANLGNEYLDTWPTNPWTGKPMANTGSMALFNTDFSSMAGLTPLAGQGGWKVENGRLVSTGAGENRLAFGDTAWTDVQLDVNAALTSGPGYGVYFRSDGKPNISGYCFQYDPGFGNEFVLRKVTAGKEAAPIRRAKMPTGFSIVGTPHDISISAVGSRIVVKVDGVTYMNFEDSTFKSGSAGLRSWGSSKVGFLSAKALSGNGTGGGLPVKGDFAYAHAQQNTSYGLVGWMAGDRAWVVQPLE